MAKIWANRLLAGTRMWDEVPDSRKDMVKSILQEIADDSDDANCAKAQEILSEID